MERISCPYCGEDISAKAKKCRFCGEWLQETSIAPVNEAVYDEETIEEVEVPVAGDSDQVPSTVNHQVPMNQMPQNPTVVSNQQPNQGLQQNIVFQPQIVVENKQEVTQEQNVIIENTGGGNSEAGGCLWTQLVLISIGLGFAFHGFWYGVAAFILLAIAVFIPFLGPALCVISGLAFGVVAGVLAASFGAATWVAWLIGIVGAIGLAYMNLEQRNSET